MQGTSIKLVPICRTCRAAQQGNKHEFAASLLAHTSKPTRRASRMHSHRACVVLIALLQCHSAQSLRPVRAISLDITGTLITHKGSVVQHYVDAAVWARLDDPPSVDEMKPAFKQAYKERCLASPCFGGAEGISGRDWWRGTARRVMELCGRSYAEEDFDRWFRSVQKLMSRRSTPSTRRLIDGSRLTDRCAQVPPRLPAFRLAEGLRGAARRGRLPRQDLRRLPPRYL